MSDAAAVLRYLAALAPRSGGDGHEVVTRRLDLAHLGWVDPTWAMGLRADPHPPAFDASSAVKQLAMVDQLHPGEHLLRLGWLFVTGTFTDGGKQRRFLFPILSARVELERAVGSYRVRPLSEPGLPQGLIEDHKQRDELEEKLGSLLTVAGPNPPEEPVLSRYTGFKVWLREFGRAAGLPPFDVRSAEFDPWRLREADGLHVTLGLSLYTARNVDQPTLASDLLNWAARDVSGTAIEAVYLPGHLEDGDGDDRIVESPYPLNEPQRTAMRRARAEPIVPVSGPPGTGKSHLVAALAVDEVARGRSVLVATQSDYAADVIADLLERRPGPRYVRFGQSAHRERVAEELAEGLAVPYDSDSVDDLEERLAEARRRVERARAGIVRLLQREADFVQGLADRELLSQQGAGVLREVDSTIDWETVRRLAESVSEEGGLFADWRSKRAERRLRELLGVGVDADAEDLAAVLRLARAERAVKLALDGGGLSLTEHWDELSSADAAWCEQAGNMIEATRRSRDNRRRISSQAVGALATALRAGRSKRRKLLRDLRSSQFLDVLPLWLGTLREIDDVLPVEAGAFDVVIFDEASQIDQMRAAPALARAKRAVVVGDPKQLRHVSFVSDDQVAAAAVEHGLEAELALVADVRRNSLFDTAAAAAPVTVLEEHFRSLPHIIGFSNREFYGGRLRLMTQHPATETRDAIRILRVDGSRNEEGVNVAEVNAVRREVRASLDAGATSLGVVSPFRGQADALEEMLLTEFHPEELARGGVRVGTVHTFQGNERDLIIVSLAVGAGDADRGLRFIEDRSLFNVLVSRARREMVVIMSLGSADIPEGLLRSYLVWAGDPPLPSRSSAPATGWVGELASALSGYSLALTANYPVAGYTVDLAVGEPDRTIGVECSVHPDGPQAHVERHLALRRAGWNLRDAFQSRWLAQPEAAVASIVEDVLVRDQSRVARAAGQ